MLDTAFSRGVCRPVKMVGNCSHASPARAPWPAVPAPPSPFTAYMLARGRPDPSSLDTHTLHHVQVQQVDNGSYRYVHRSFHACSVCRKESGGGKLSKTDCKTETGREASAGVCRCRRSWNISNSGTRWPRCSSTISQTGSFGDGQQTENTQPNQHTSCCIKVPPRCLATN